jgi:hypothetical protein
LNTKATPFTKEQFNQLELKQNWEIVDISPESWNKIPGIQRLRDTFAIMGSACLTDPRCLNRLNGVAGIDVLISEAHPKIGEPEGNAYHYVFQYTGNPNYPYTMYGPFKAETKVLHWFNVDDLDSYWIDKTDLT